jgi:hypothetical protein
MAEQSEDVPNQAICHTKQCSQLASYSCDHCGRAYCALHIRQISVERRQARTHEDNGLARLPTFTETYWLCPSCWNKPVPGK